MDVAFYQLNRTPLERALPKLLEKIYGSGMRALVLCDSQEKVELLNNMLWTFSPGAFLPHGFQGDPKRHPIWLSTSPENVNDANIIVVTNGEVISTSTEAPKQEKEKDKDKDTPHPYEKCIDIFEGSCQESTLSARERYRIYQSRNCTLTFWKQDTDGAWEKGG